MENFIITIICLVIGMGIRQIKAFPDETGIVLNLFVIYISLPALILLKIPHLVFDTNLFVPALMPWVLLLFSAALILILSRIFKWSQSSTGALLLVIPLGNTSFLGIPMVDIFFGSDAVPYAVIYDQLGTFLALATYGSVVLAFYGDGEKKISPGKIIKKIITFPPFIALLVAAITRMFSYPPAVTNILTTLSSTLVPVVMVAVGFQLSFKFGRENIPILFTGLSLKLLIVPFIALAISSITGFTDEMTKVSIFESAMPPMISAGALAINAGLSPKLTAALVGIGIIVSFVTLPLFFQLL